MDSRDDPEVTAARPKCPSISSSVSITDTVSTVTVRLRLMIIKTGLMCNSLSNEKTELDRGSIRSSPRYGSSPPMRLTMEQRWELGLGTALWIGTHFGSYPAKCRGGPARCTGGPARCTGGPAKCSGGPARCRDGPAKFKCWSGPSKCRGGPAKCKGGPANVGVTQSMLEWPSQV